MQTRIFCMENIREMVMLQPELTQKDSPNGLIPKGEQFFNFSICSQWISYFICTRTKLPLQNFLTFEEKIIDAVRTNTSLSVRKLSQNIWSIMNGEGLYAYHMTPIGGSFTWQLRERKDSSEIHFIHRVVNFSMRWYFQLMYEHLWVEENPQDTREGCSQYQFKANVWAEIIHL